MNTQIFATMGPACGTEEIITDMIRAGMTGMRLNLSHTTLPESQHYIDAYHKAAKTTDTQAQILIDMQGPELRVGDLVEPVELAEGDVVRFYSREEAFVPESEKPEIVIPVPLEVMKALVVGDEVLLDDGKILARVISEDALTVLRGGILRAHKSIKIVDKDVEMPVLTSHDIANICLAKEYGVTALMQPFVRCGEDIKKVRQLLAENQAEDLRIFAKIENRTGVENRKEIIREADVIVIARGDLGNDMPLWELPAVQKDIEETCHRFHKPYIVVTQMLASMEHSPVPTRAEVSDIFHAVYHGAWGVMVTGETAVGEYPVEVIRYLANTAKAVMPDFEKELEQTYCRSKENFGTLMKFQGYEYELSLLEYEGFVDGSAKPYNPLKQPSIELTGQQVQISMQDLLNLNPEDVNYLMLCLRRAKNLSEYIKEKFPSKKTPI